MGYNSVVLVLNDCLSDISNDKEFGKKLDSAISRVYGNDPIDISSGCSVNAATAISCQHADVTQIIAVGGNYATVLGNFFGSHHKEESQIELLKQLADKYGYRLVPLINKENKKFLK